MATFRKNITLGAGTHVLRFRVVSPSGTVQLRPVSVQYGAEMNAAESATAADAVQARLLLPISITETLVTADETAGMQIALASLAEAIQMYDRYKVPPTTVGDLLRGRTGFRPWWNRTQGGGSLWYRRRP